MKVALYRKAILVFPLSASLEVGFLSGESTWIRSGEYLGSCLNYWQVKLCYEQMFKECVQYLRVRVDPNGFN